MTNITLKCTDPSCTYTCRRSLDMWGGPRGFNSGVQGQHATCIHGHGPMVRSVPRKKKQKPKYGPTGVKRHNRPEPE